MTPSNTNLAVDANVLLEILAARAAADQCLNILQGYQNLYLSPTTIHIIYYFAYTYGLPKDGISLFLKDYKIMTFGQNTFERALTICPDEDMEDALQIATAIDARIPNFFTLDKKMVHSYKHLIDFA